MKFFDLNGKRIWLTDKIFLTEKKNLAFAFPLAYRDKIVLMIIKRKKEVAVLGVCGEKI